MRLLTILLHCGLKVSAGRRENIKYLFMLIHTPCQYIKLLGRSVSENQSFIL